MKLLLQKATAFMSSWNAADLVIYLGVQAARSPPTKYVSLFSYIFGYLSLNRVGWNVGLIFN